MTSYILSIDQGTTSTRAIIFNEKTKIIASSEQAFSQVFPDDGWVEHDPEEIWQSVVYTCKNALNKAALVAKDITSMGITNQRETTLVWNKNTGKCIYNAIVWQDRRTAKRCQELQQSNTFLDEIKAKTGLLLDPYFSATKLEWLLNNIKGARKSAEAGDLLFGTIDSFLLWRLTGGEQHATYATNAARTLLFDIHKQQWDEELLNCFNIPKAMLPTVKNCADDYGKTIVDLFGDSISIGGIAGDQHAALIGQGCIKQGMVKSTYGTGCFMMVNTGKKSLSSKHQLLTTIAYRLNGETTYALEGSIFMAGATLQWLRDGLQLIEQASDSEKLAKEMSTLNTVYMVPAFTGLGAPYWQADIRGAILGLTRDSGIKEIVTAALQAVAYQSKDLLDAMVKDGQTIENLRVDGGMVNNNWLMQFLSDILSLPVTRSTIIETTALGVAYLAGVHSGVFQNLEEVGELWQEERSFTTNMDAYQSDILYSGWLKSVEQVCYTNSNK